MRFAKIALLMLVGLGAVSSFRLAFFQWATGEACPVVGSVPACYVAFAGYGLMLIGLIAAWAKGRRTMFRLGIAIAGGLALVGSTMELVQGDVCPRAGSVPLCYVSLAMSLVILWLFELTSRESASRQEA